jgi:Tol biopolymer transport system component
VLVRSVAGSNELVRVRIADGAERPLTATPRREESWPYWSEAAGRLVFQLSAGGSDSDLALWTPGRGESALAATPRRAEHWPAWSPRAAQLVWAFRGGEGPSAGLALHDFAQGGTRVVAASGERDYFLRPSFSPGGERLVAQRRGPDGRGSQLWIVELGAPPRALTADAAWFDMKPLFARDGARIFFSRRPAAGGARDVASVDLAGGDLRLHASLPDADDHSAAPSPTRDELAFVSERAGDSAVFLVELPSGAPRPIGGPGRAAFAPRWSPDGERLALLTTPAGAGEPRLADRESLRALRVQVCDRAGRVLLDVPGFMPDWMPAWR